MLPALAPLARLRQVALGRSQAVMDSAPHGPTLPSCVGEVGASCSDGAQAKGEGCWSGFEFGQTTVTTRSSLGAMQPQNGQSIGPRSPVRGRSDALRTLESESAEACRQERQVSHGSDLGILVVWLTKKLTQTLPNCVVVAACVRCQEVGRQGAQQVICTWGGTHAKDEPRTLHVRPEARVCL